MGTFQYTLSIKDNPKIKDWINGDNDFKKKILEQYNYELIFKQLFSKNEVNDDMINNTVLYLKSKDFEQNNDGKRKSKRKN